MNTTENKNKQKILQRMIILCWIILAVCFVIKLLGGNFFSIVVSNETYQTICSYVDHHIWIRILIGSTSTTLLNVLFLLAVNRKLNFTKFEWILVVISSISIAVIKQFNNTLGLICDVYQMFILPFIIKTDCLIEHKIRYAIFGNILVLLFQMATLLTKNLSLVIVTNDFLTGSIWIIDVYIMCTLYYLYANIKIGGKKMSWFAGWLWGKSTSQLEKMKNTRLKKLAKLNKEVEAIDAEIAKQNENKK